ncbi:unnamed protein product, partial [Cyprideis torosa]
SNVLSDMVNGLVDISGTAIELAIGIVGVMVLFLGLLKIGEKAGLIESLSKVVSPFFSVLFPDIPKNHPAIGHMMMNFSANLLGLDNAATPFGLKAMESLQELNPSKDTASNAQIMFTALLASGLTLVPVSVIAYRAAANAQDPTDIFLPILLSTTVATLAAIFIVGIRQKLNFFKPAFIFGILGLSGKEGWDIAVKVMPYLVAMLAAISVLRSSGVLNMFTDALSYLVAALGGDTKFIEALPTALMKPLSGSGARGLMVESMTTFGPDSFTGRLSSVFQGATDTTFYIVALYFGSIGVTNSRYTITASLLAELAGVIAAILITYIYFSMGIWNDVPLPTKP